MKPGSYKVLTLICVIFCFAFLIVINHQTLQKNKNLQFLTPKPKLELKDNILQLKLSHQIKLIELHFVKPLDDTPTVLERNDIVKITKISDEKQWIHIEAQKGYLNTNKIKILLSSPKFANINKRRFIDIITVDGKKISVHEFYYEDISKLNSNVAIYYPLTISNISHSMAKGVGKILLTGIIVILQGLLLLQIVFFMFCFFLQQPEIVTSYFFNPDESSPLTWVDQIANEFSIHLGFLGTIVSIWISLEFSNLNFQNFGDILSIIRTAIFTSVLGLMIKVLSMVRSKNISIQRLFKKASGSDNV